MLHQTYDVGSVLAAEFMPLQNINEQENNITLADLNKEIQKNKEYIMLQARYAIHEGCCLRVMDYVLSVSQLATTRKHNSPAGKKAIRDMRAAIAVLENM